MIRLFRVFIPTSVVALLISEIVLVFACFVLATYVVLEVGPDVMLLYEGGLGNIAIVAASVILGLYFNDLYTELRVRSRIALTQQLCLVIGAAFLVQALLSYVNRELMVPHNIMMAGSAFLLLSLPAWRLLYNQTVVKALGGHRLLFVGNDPIVGEIAERVSKHPELGYEVVGSVNDPLDDSQVSASRVLGTIDGLEHVVHQVKPDRIVIGMTERRRRLPVFELLDLRLAGIPIIPASDLYEIAFGRICTRALRPSDLIFASEIGPSKRTQLMQSIYSVVLAVIGTTITAPLMMLVAIAVKLTSRGPLLYRQTRVGLHDRLFTVYKFRSMYAHAEADTGPVWAAENDPRVTPVGRWLRKLRIDELPQFFNVLRGDMAFVGPRPERPEFVRTLTEQIPYYRLRHCVKPGITGWAQISYKYANTFADTITKLEYDLYYIKHLSASLDMYIIFHTLKTMLLSRGVN
jgi:sugar transferase (PEP-CTERM system associated)